MTGLEVNTMGFLLSSSVFMFLPVSSVWSSVVPVKRVAQFAERKTKKKKKFSLCNGKSHGTKAKHRASPEKE